MLEINIKQYLKITHIFSSAMWHLPRQIFDLAIGSLNKIKRLSHPSAPAPSNQYHALNLDWWFISYMILYMFQCHSPKSSHPLPLPQSPKDCSIHLCLFCYVLKKKIKRLTKHKGWLQRRKYLNEKLTPKWEMNIKDTWKKSYIFGN